MKKIVNILKKNVKEKREKWPQHKVRESIGVGRRERVPHVLIKVGKK